MKVIKNHPKLLFSLTVAIVFITCYSFINIGHNKDNKQTDSIKILVTSSNSGDVVFDAVINQERLKKQKTPFEYNLPTTTLQSVFHQVSGNGKIFIEVKDDKGKMTSDFSITVILVKNGAKTCFGLE